ncbi:MAG TPA: nucleotide pyrophosphohydrolase [Bacteroidales bacterium]|jgi:NTP pyrophosphatase (non-canonical NTP hydrolase)|nr:nucleotide pyrophosphohydrolase [Bacteroidales bacterium]HOL97350.1 nucleotide pyrophosphohydrolase [Bacteroidales bacterium]HOM36081.1 nucleotide pyrophosphohydrolase [Bacteroidales bacterium]HPD22916.1 nucleotide pyrophosphohydrolase [Bacteroidales bacterium]HRS98584.1 nucleotide pyrophosphohydrolase [Bacteroidales bacterium]
MSIDELQKIVDDWIKKYGVRYFDVKTNMIVLTEEIGEMARVIARQFGEQSKKEDETLSLSEEIADVLWVLTCIANQTGINLTDAIQKNIEKKTNRDNKRHIQNKKLNL